MRPPTGFNVRDLLNLQDDSDDAESESEIIRRRTTSKTRRRRKSTTSSGDEADVDEAAIEEEDEVDTRSMSAGLSTPPSSIELGELTASAMTMGSTTTYYDHENPYTRWLQSNDAMQAYSGENMHR